MQIKYFFLQPYNTTVFNISNWYIFIFYLKTMHIKTVFQSLQSYTEFKK